MDTDDFGYQLREARLKRGHTIEEIARRTKIPAPTLERLESSERAALPADVFVCGFLRAYAREVGLDGEEAVARFRRQAKSPEGRDPSYASLTITGTSDEEPVAAASPIGDKLDAIIAALTSRIPMLEDALGRKPAFALMVLLVVLVATLTLSLLLGGDPTPGRGLS